MAPSRGSRYIRRLDALSLTDRPLAGGKAAGLGELARAGFSIGEGFCLLAPALELFFKENHLDKLILELARVANPCEPLLLGRMTRSIQRQIVEAPLPEAIERPLRRAYTALDGKGQALVAVRSSVGVKGGDRFSFPGQMQTWHGIQGVAMVMEHMRKCWASAWTDRAVLAVLSAGASPADVFVAPIVQKMVPADAAGVLFTADPATGRTDRMVINACPGLGTGVVEGNQTPDQWVVDKDDGRVMEERPGDKQTQEICLPGGGVEKVPLPAKQARALCLNARQVHELASMGPMIEKHFGEPQDVEWAFSGRRLTFLQSRPVVLPRTRGRSFDQPGEFDSPPGDPPRIFTSFNIGEVLPGVLSPVSLSTMKVLDYGFWKPNHYLGLHAGDFPEGDSEFVFLGFFYGRAHLDLTTALGILGKVPFMKSSEVERGLALAPEIQEEISSQKPSPMQLLAGLARLPALTARGLRMHKWAEANMEPFRRAILAQKQALGERDLDRLSGASLAEILEQNNRLGYGPMVLHIVNSQIAVAAFDALLSLTKKWLADDTGALASRLVTGLATLESARPGFGVYDLYRQALSMDTVRKILMENPAREAVLILEESGEPQARKFLSALDDFLQEYGHRGVLEAEIMLPAWEQDPGFVVAMIQNFFTGTGIEDPRKKERQLGRVREQSARRARSDLSLVKRRVFDRALGLSQKFLAARENSKDLVLVGINGRRKLVLAAGKQLSAKGLLARPDDVFFCTYSEILGLLRDKGEPTQNQALLKAVKTRRRTLRLNQSVSLAPTFQGRPDPLGSVEMDQGGGNVLSGVCVCPGQVRGRARVIMDPRTDGAIRPGEILVAPVTDASWTPLFLAAGAIVVDVGGLLSHGSVVAREYGVPGVINTGCATRKIKTGQMVFVDADQGKVYLEDS